MASRNGIVDVIALHFNLIYSLANFLRVLSYYTSRVYFAPTCAKKSACTISEKEDSFISLFVHSGCVCVSFVIFSFFLSFTYALQFLLISHDTRSLNLHKMC